MADLENNTGIAHQEIAYKKPSLLAEFRNFLLGGDFIKLACAFVLALALEKLIRQFVASFISPIIGIIGSRSFETRFHHS
jgi:large-conductance mechanosensitive channel